MPFFREINTVRFSYEHVDFMEVLLKMPEYSHNLPDTRFDHFFYFSEHKDEDFKENLKYSIQRLISGLASDRTTSRKGYFTCLVYMLQAFEEEISVKTVFELVTKLLNVKGSKSVS